MPRTYPWHSIHPMDRNVYHNNTRCTEGNNIERQNIRPGTGGHPLCHHCNRLNIEGK